MKKEIFYLIGALVGALLVLLAVPLGANYAWAYLSANGGGMDTPELCAAHAERGNGFSDPGRCSFGPLRRGVSFPAQTVSDDFILECPGVQWYAGVFSSCAVGKFSSTS